jgi:uncharacterized membrane protein AbrB (regulator of aidB expression)
MKSCSQCGKSYAPSRVLCLDCCEILEEKQYLRLVWVTLAIAFLVHLVLAQYGYAGSGLIMESLMSETFLLIVSVVAWKCFQKWKSPQRRILYEVVSLYSDRAGRVIILGATIFALLVLSGVITFKAARIDEPPLLVCFRLIRYYAILSCGLLYLVLALSIQKLNFFDFRLRNSLIQQELENRDNVG